MQNLRRCVSEERSLQVREQEAGGQERPSTEQAENAAKKRAAKENSREEQDAWFTLGTVD